VANFLGWGGFCQNHAGPWVHTPTVHLTFGWKVLNMYKIANPTVENFLGLYVLIEKLLFIILRG